MRFCYGGLVCGIFHWLPGAQLDAADWVEEGRCAAARRLHLLQVHYLPFAEGQSYKVSANHCGWSSPLAGFGDPTFLENSCKRGSCPIL